MQSRGEGLVFDDAIDVNYIPGSQLVPIYRSTADIAHHRAEHVSKRPHICQRQHQSQKREGGK